MDILIPYVDNSDAAWQQVYLSSQKLHFKSPKMAAVAVKAANRRFASYGLFKYWWRALDANFRGDYAVHLLLMQESQVPSWLDTSKVHIHYHEDFIPRHLRPCFNSSTIELCAMKGLQLSETYLLLNDDMYFNQPTGPGDFAEGNVPFASYKVGKPYGGTAFRDVLENGRRLISRHVGREVPPYAIHHLAQVYQDSYAKALLSSLWDEVLPRLTKKRHPSNVNHLMVMMGQNAEGVSRADARFPSSGYFDCSKLRGVSQETLSRPKVLCLNDTDASGLGCARAYLQSRYAAPSRFEL